MQLADIEGMRPHASRLKPAAGVRVGGAHQYRGADGQGIGRLGGSRSSTEITRKGPKVEGSIQSGFTSSMSGGMKLQALFRCSQPAGRTFSTR